jgi:uncharacterized protein with PIN domain
MTAIEVSEFYQRADEPGVICLMIKMNTLSTDFSKVGHSILIANIASAVREYVAKHKAHEIYGAIEQTAEEEIEKMVREHVRQVALELVGKLDLDAMAKLAAIEAAKTFGREVTK